MRRQQAPAAPNPYVVADAQSKLNRETAQNQQQLNMVNQNTPTGSMTYRQIGTWPDGTPRYEAVSALSEGQQTLLSNQEALGGQLGSIAMDQAGRVASTLGTPLDLSDPTIGSAIMSRYDPRLQEGKARDWNTLNTDLVNRGIRPGSTAWDEAVAQFNRSYGDRENQLMIDARGQTIGELLTQRNQPLSELTALGSFGQPQGVNPQATPQTGVANTDIAGPMNTQWQAQMAQWQADQDRRQARLGALASIAGSALGGWAMSDRKTKEDIKKVGKLNDGSNVYAFRYKDGMGGGLMRLGVMADEIAGKHPEAVAEVAPDLQAVNYSALADALAERAA
jgi:hypothetical protein